MEKKEKIVIALLVVVLVSLGYAIYQHKSNIEPSRVLKGQSYYLQTLPGDTLTSVSIKIDNTSFDRWTDMKFRSEKNRIWITDPIPRIEVYNRYYTVNIRFEISNLKGNQKLQTNFTNDFDGNLSFRFEANKK